MSLRRLKLRDVTDLYRMRRLVECGALREDEALREDGRLRDE